MARLRIKTKKFHAAFVNLVNPRPDKKGVVKHEVTMIFPEGCDLSELEALQEEAIQYGTQKLWGGKRPKKLKLPIKSSDTDAGDWAGFTDGTMFAKAWTGESNPPTVYDQSKKEVTDTSTIYSGCYCWAILEAGPYDHPEGGKGVSFYLCGIQKLEDGEPFAGRRSCEDDFDVIDPSTAPEVDSSGVDF